MMLSQALRITLPLAALALLSTIFLVSRSIDPDRAVALSEIDMSALTREPRIGTARVAGVTSDNTTLVIEAAAMSAPGTQPQSEPVDLRLDAPSGTLGFASGREITFASATGTLDRIADQVALTGDVQLQSSDGFRAQMPRLTAALGETRVLGYGGIRAEGPPGEITADRLSISVPPGATDGYLLAFSGNVRLIYQPQE
ncbi:MAG: hypothetical protein EA339_10555 [Rhodobacteraceae bacterium]|nr:MAG: hypothetical protein EA339_10555 [Paracoccaceae bacterium]